MPEKLKNVEDDPMAEIKRKVLFEELIEADMIINGNKEGDKTEAGRTFLEYTENAKRDHVFNDTSVLETLLLIIKEIEPLKEKAQELFDTRRKEIHQGRICIQGQAEGRAKIIRSVADFGHIGPGQVIVCEDLPYRMGNGNNNDQTRRNSCWHRGPNESQRDNYERNV